MLAFGLLAVGCARDYTPPPEAMAPRLLDLHALDRRPIPGKAIRLGWRAGDRFAVEIRATYEVKGRFTQVTVAGTVSVTYVVESLAEGGTATLRGRVTRFSVRNVDPSKDNITVDIDWDDSKDPSTIAGSFSNVVRDCAREEIRAAVGPNGDIETSAKLFHPNGVFVPEPGIPLSLFGLLPRLWFAEPREVAPGEGPSMADIGGFARRRECTFEGWDGDQAVFLCRLFSAYPGKPGRNQIEGQGATWFDAARGLPTRALGRYRIEGVINGFEHVVLQEFSSILRSVP
jgi:hypothetical protein